MGDRRIIVRVIADVVGISSGSFNAILIWYIRQKTFRNKMLNFEKELRLEEIAEWNQQ